MARWSTGLPESTRGSPLASISSRSTRCEPLWSISATAIWARVFTEHEVACSSGEADVRARHLAARFAAKEAAMKALGPSDRPPAWRSIEVRQDDSGRCTLRLSDEAAELARRARLDDFAVSLSHEGNLAVAVVFALGRTEA